MLTQHADSGLDRLRSPERESDWPAATYEEGQNAGVAAAIPAFLHPVTFLQVASPLCNVALLDTCNVALHH